MTTTQALEPELPELPEPLEIIWPELHSHALGCGVEDRNIHDRYEAAEYGWQDGVDKAAECVPDQLFTAEDMRAYALSAIAADRKKREGGIHEAVKQGFIAAAKRKQHLATTRDILKSAERYADLYIGRIVVPANSTAPVSAGLSDESIVRLAADNALGIEGDGTLRVYLMPGTDISHLVIQFARALSARLLPEGYVAVPNGFRLEKLYEPERIKVEKIGEGFCCFCKTGNGGVETAAYEILNALIAAAPNDVQAKPRQKGHS